MVDYLDKNIHAVYLVTTVVQWPVARDQWNQRTGASIQGYGPKIKWLLSKMRYWNPIWYISSVSSVKSCGRKVTLLTVQLWLRLKEMSGYQWAEKHNYRLHTTQGSQRRPSGDFPTNIYYHTMVSRLNETSQATRARYVPEIMLFLRAFAASNMWHKVIYKCDFASLTFWAHQSVDHTFVMRSPLSQRCTIKWLMVGVQENLWILINRMPDLCTNRQQQIATTASS
jgi:hypothetical protein